MVTIHTRVCLYWLGLTVFLSTNHSTSNIEIFIDTILITTKEPCMLHYLYSGK